MRLLTDQDVYAATSRFLLGLGHDVLRASDVGLAQASDEGLLQFAKQEQRIFLTRDRDFGSLVFVQGRPGGVIYLRNASLDSCRSTCRVGARLWPLLGNYAVRFIHRR